MGVLQDQGLGFQVGFFLPSFLLLSLAGSLIWPTDYHLLFSPALALLRDAQLPHVVRARNLADDRSALFTSCPVPHRRPRPSSTR